MRETVDLSTRDKVTIIAICAFWSFCVWYGLNDQILTNRKMIDSINRMGAEGFREWVKEFKDANPGLIVPSLK